MADAAENTTAENQPPTPDDGDTNLEELQRQLEDMEAEQSQLESRLQEQTETVEPQLDSRLAAIEEQFRSSFDDRLLGSNTSRPAVRRAPLGDGPGEVDLLLINRVFREASRLIGDEWRPVYDALMAPYAADDVSAQRESLEKQPSIIQGYRALLAWRETSGAKFDMRRLVEVLRTCNMEDVADAVVALLEGQEVSSKTDDKSKQTKPVQRRKSDVTSKGKAGVLDNRRMLLLAKKVGGDWEPLAKELGVSEEEINEIKESADASTYQGAFKMLWAWRQTRPSGDDQGSTEVLRAALQQVNKGQLIDQIAAN